MASMTTPDELRPLVPPQRDICWQAGTIDRTERWEALEQRGATIWFTGLSGSGKSTIAALVEEHLVRSGRWAYRLDGDNLRHGVCADLGFSPDDRAENVRRVAEMALLFADAGAVSLVCLVSPYAADRRCARERHEAAGLEFVEVFVNTSLAECARRDVKGLYAKARDGALSNLTGVGAPYEAPADAEVELTEALSIPDAAARVLALVPPIRG
jgi:adenylyl-sulfate kinase